MTRVGDYLKFTEWGRKRRKNCGHSTL